MPVEIKLHSGLTLEFDGGKIGNLAGRPATFPTITVNLHRKGYAPRTYAIRPSDAEAIRRELES